MEPTKTCPIKVNGQVCGSPGVQPYIAMSGKLLFLCDEHYLVFCKRREQEFERENGEIDD